MQHLRVKSEICVHGSLFKEASGGAFPVKDLHLIELSNL